MFSICKCLECLISIHAPARGATCISAPGASHLHISIHAPARGATVLVRGFSNNYCDFNPRPREGSDLVCTCLRIPTREFQSTPPRGERHRLLPIDGSRHYFNPRPREGSDVGLGLIVDDPSQFQSTPPRGERPPRTWSCIRRCGISIHAPARGATWRTLFGSYPSLLFQSTPPRGERRF